MGKESSETQVYGTGSLCCARQIYVVALRLLVYTAGVLYCAAPQAPSPQLAVVDTVSDLSHPHSIVMRRLFDAAHGLLASGDAGGAMRVATLCRRLANGDIDVKLAAANLNCRAGDILGAHAGFLLVWALARKQCPDPDLKLARDGVSIVRKCSEEELHDIQRWMVSSSASHGMCLMEARRFDLAAVRFRDALAIDQVRALHLLNHKTREIERAGGLSEGREVRRVERASERARSDVQETKGPNFSR